MNFEIFKSIIDILPKIIEAKQEKRSLTKYEELSYIILSSSSFSINIISPESISKADEAFFEKYTLHIIKFISPTKNIIIFFIGFKYPGENGFKQLHKNTINVNRHK